MTEIIVTSLIVILARGLFIGIGIWFIIIGVKDEVKSFVAIGVVFIVLMAIPIIGAIYDGYQKDNSELTIEYTQLIVSNKDYNPARTQVISSGKNTNTIFHAERWDITLTDGEHTKTIDNESLFKSLEEGDKIEGYRYIYTKKNGEVYTVELKIKGFEDN